MNKNPDGLEPRVQLNEVVYDSSAKGKSLDDLKVEFSNIYQQYRKLRSQIH